MNSARSQVETTEVQEEQRGQLAALRADLDALDESLRFLLLSRFRLCRQIAELKKDLEMPMVQEERVRIVQANAARFAGTHGMRPEFLRNLYSLIVDEAHKQEAEVFAGARSDAPT